MIKIQLVLLTFILLDTKWNTLNPANIQTNPAINSKVLFSTLNVSFLKKYS
ncbi:hypothetical protein CBOS2020_21470 [Clostridium botulinum]|nr:hypothetical protein CBOS2020_21470 [Clostridium botulinum]